MNFLSNGVKSLRFLLLLLATYLLIKVLAHDLPSQLPLISLSSFSHGHSLPSTHPSPPFLGINTALEQSAPPVRRATLARLRATGFGWVRQRLDWGALEPTPGAYDWRVSDALVHDIHAAGLVPVIVLDGSPAWARAPQDRAPTDNPWAPPADVQDFARFAAAFATRYGDQLDFYQIWDEPNIAPHWGNQLIEPVGYAQLLKVAAQAIRAADPNATLISAALAPTRDRGHTAIDEVYYLQRLYAAGAAPSFDVLAIQPFGFGHAPADPQPRVDRLNFARAQLLRQTLVAAGDGETPIWAVRYGWNRQLASPWATVSAADQRRFATAALTLARDQWPWLTAMAWAVDQPAAPAADPIWGFALTPPLAAALQGWVQGADAPHRLKPVAGNQNLLKQVRAALPRWGVGLGWLLLLLGVGWRTVAVARQLPWTRWGLRYRQQPWWLHVAVWAMLAVIYYFATAPALIQLCWLPAVILLRWQPHVGLWLAAALLPFYGQHKEFVLGALAVDIAPSHAVLICLALALVWDTRLTFRGRTVTTLFTQISGSVSPERQPTHADRASPSRHFSLSHLALLWLLLNLLHAPNGWPWSAYSEGLWDLVLLPLLGFGLVRTFVTTAAQARHLLLALFLGGVAVAGGGLIDWWRGAGTAVDGLLRLAGPYFSPNQAALYLERTLFLGGGLLWAWPRDRGWLAAAGGLLLVALLLTASRGALLLGLPAGALLWAWGWWRRQVQPWPALLLYRHRRLLLPAALALAGLAVLLLVLLLGERLTNSATILHRLTIWQSSLALWRDFPWIGVGPGGFFWRYPAYLPLGALAEPNLHHPHNLWLELATGWGVLGLLWLGLLLWWLVGRLRVGERAPAPIKGFVLALLAAFAAGLAHAQVDAFLVLPDLALWSWLALALLDRLVPCTLNPRVRTTVGGITSDAQLCHSVVSPQMGRTLNPRNP